MEDLSTTVAGSSSERINATSQSSSRRSSRSSGGSSKSSSIGSQLNEVVSPSEKEEVLNMYRNLDGAKLWKLSTGKVVEREMKKLVEKSVYEHPAHSFILDPQDENWCEYFSEDELAEIRSHKLKEVPALPSELVKFLDSIEQTVSKPEHCSKYRAKV
jgi:hypothetical protein